MQGSPHVFLPDGTASFNPGIGKIDWVRGIPVPTEVDESEIAKLLERSALPEPRPEKSDESA